MKLKTTIGIMATLFIISSLAFNIQTVKAEPETLTFSDDFSSDSGMWEYLGTAHRDPSNQFVVLTEPINDRAGVVFFKTTFRYSFTANFSYKAGGGSGGDGFVMFFYKQKYSTIGYGGGLGFSVGTINPIPGYGIEFDNWRNLALSPGEHLDPSANHIALIKDHVGNHLIYVDDLRTEDNSWHDVSVTVEESSIRVLIDESLVLQWDGEIDRTYDYFGFSGATGSATNWHIIDNFSIEIRIPTPPPPTITSVSRIPTTPSYDEEVTVTATITDDIAVDEALLSYTYEETWHNVSMNRFDDTFSATIPAQPYGTPVQYMVYANDTDGLWAVSDTYSYVVIDNVPPAIHFVQCTPLLNIYANITEPADASGIDRVLLSLRMGTGEWWNTTLTYDTTLGLWKTTIFGYNQLAGNTITYLVEAYDKAGNKKTSEILSYSVEKWRIADLNRDGKVDRADLLILIKYLRPVDASLIAFAFILTGSVVYVKHRKKPKNINSLQ